MMFTISSTDSSTGFQCNNASLKQTSCSFPLPEFASWSVFTTHQLRFFHKLTRIRLSKSPALPKQQMAGQRYKPPQNTYDTDAMFSEPCVSFWWAPRIMPHSSWWGLNKEKVSFLWFLIWLSLSTSKWFFTFTNTAFHWFCTIFLRKREIIYAVLISLLLLAVPVKHKALG